VRRPRVGAPGYPDRDRKETNLDTKDKEKASCQHHRLSLVSVRSQT